MKKTGFVVGKTDTRYLTLATIGQPYIQSEFFIIQDRNHGSVPCEVVETTALPCIDADLLPENCTPKSLAILGEIPNTPIFLATVKVLKDLPYPILPNATAVSAEYAEIEQIISSAVVGDSMAIGVIKGTELSQDDLPSQLKNVAPLWSNGQAVHQQGVPLLLNHHAFREYPHIGLFGSSGSGKSFAMRVLLEELMRLQIPGLVLDPHYESRFVGTMNGLGPEHDFDFESRHQAFTIGTDVGIQFTDLSLSELTTLFQFVDALTEPQRSALEVLYEKGITFKHLQAQINTLKSAFEKKEASRTARKKDVENELTANEHMLFEQCKNRVSGAQTLQALGWKCAALDATNIFTSNTENVKRAMLQGKLAVIRGDILRMQMISAYLVNKLYSQRRQYVDKDGSFFPPFFTVVDEAHNFAPEDGKSTPTRNILRKIGQEARKYGVFLMLCTQRPRNLDATLLAQLNTKFIFRLTDESDMQVAKVEGNLTTNQVSTLPDLASGNCFVSSAILNKTYPVRFRTTFSKAPNITDPFDELKLIVQEQQTLITDELKEFLPMSGVEIGRNLPKLQKIYGETATLKDIITHLNTLVRAGELKKEIVPGIGPLYRI